MKDLIKRLFLLSIGVLLISINVVLTVHSQTGPSPWTVFHLGLSNVTGLTLGQATQVTGLLVIIIAAFFGEYPGWGTLYNAIMSGLGVDLIRHYELIPYASGPWQRWLMLFAALVTIGLGTFLYLQAGYGSGPRDSLMVGIIKKFRQPLWKIRLTIETTAVTAGYLMGGQVGIGTLLNAVLTGFFIQFFYRISGKKPSDIRHRVIWDDLRLFSDYRRKKSKTPE